MLLANPIDYFLIIGRPKDKPEAAPWIAFETTKLPEANSKCQELNKTDLANTYKIETWTKVR